MSDRELNEPDIRGLERIMDMEHRIREIQRAVSNIERRIEHEVPRMHASSFRAIEALVTTFRYLDPDDTLPPLAGPFGGWAISAEMARLLGRLVSSTRPSLVVELGSGSSTVLLGKLLAKMGGGRLVSLEHDPIWYTQTVEFLHDSGLGGSVDLRYAPLSPVTIGSREYQWYSRDAIGDLDEVDMILVDGPPAFIGEQARYPAVPMLGPHMADGGLVVIDDYSRGDEREMVTTWLEETGMILREEHLWHRKGAAVLEWVASEVTDG